jgi:hypothetical protein
MKKASQATRSGKSGAKAPGGGSFLGSQHSVLEKADSYETMFRKSALYILRIRITRVMFIIVCGLLHRLPSFGLFVIKLLLRVLSGRN